MKPMTDYLDLAEVMLQSLKEQQRDINKLSQAAREQERFKADINERITRLEQKIQDIQKETKVEDKNIAQSATENKQAKMRRIQVRDIDDLPKILFSLGVI